MEIVKTPTEVKDFLNAPLRDLFEAIVVHRDERQAKVNEIAFLLSSAVNKRG